MKTLVCLISRQVMANLIPILTLDIQKVVLLYTKEEQRSHSNIKQAIEGIGRDIRLEEHLIGAYDFEGVQQLCRKLIQENNEIVLNTTGGTKVMAFAAYSAFNHEKKPIFYLDSFDNKAIYFNPYKVTEHIVKIPLEIMLAAHGYKILNFRSVQELETRKSLVIFIGNFYYQLYGCLAQYRRYMFNNIKYFSPIIFRELGFEISWVKNGGIRIKYGNKTILLSDYDYLNGLWLEELTYWYIHDKGWDDLKVGVSLSYQGQIIEESDTLNEVDLMGIKNGKLYLFSCKAGITKDKKDIFELEALRSLAGGTFGKAYFINSMPIIKEKHIVDRCKELKIPVFDHQNFLEIKNLKLK